MKMLSVIVLLIFAQVAQAAPTSTIQFLAWSKLNYVGDDSELQTDCETSANQFKQNIPLITKSNDFTVLKNAVPYTTTPIYTAEAPEYVAHQQNFGCHLSVALGSNQYGFVNANRHIEKDVNEHGDVEAMCSNQERWLVHQNPSIVYIRYESDFHEAVFWGSNTGSCDFTIYKLVKI